jgi:hypothetical protein
MRKTIDDVLDRGNKLDGMIVSAKLFYRLLYSFILFCLDVSEMSRNLSSESKKYNWKAKQLSLVVSNCFIICA